MPHTPELVACCNAAQTESMSFAMLNITGYLVQSAASALIASSELRFVVLLNGAESPALACWIEGTTDGTQLTHYLCSKRFWGSANQYILWHMHLRSIAVTTTDQLPSIAATFVQKVLMHT